MPQTQNSPQKEDNKKGRRFSGKKKVAIAAVCILVALVVLCASLFAALYFEVEQALDTGYAGSLETGLYTPKEYEGDVVNILFVGIYRKPTDTYPEGLGLTDVILYLHFDLKNNRLSGMQIPRDTYVGEIPNSDAKINSLLVTGPDTENYINNLATAISDQYALPIDHYIAINMDSLLEIVDIFNGLRVYVPKEMNYKGNLLQEGWQWLDSNAVNFFVRNRYGKGFERSDIDRLENQRHFYSALFRRFMNLTPIDCVKLLPIIKEHCLTDFETTDLFDLAFSALKLTPENIMFCLAPGATKTAEWDTDPLHLDRYFYIIDLYGPQDGSQPGMAEILNTYFRTYGDEVEIDDLKAPKIKIPSSVPLYPPNIQTMGQLYTDEGGSEIDVEPNA